MTETQKFNALIDDVGESIIQEALQHFNIKRVRIKDDDSRFLTREEYKKFCERYTGDTKIDVSVVNDDNGKFMFYELKHIYDDNGQIVFDKTIVAKPQAIKKRGKPIRCVETGEIFDTVKDAARWREVTDSAITHCLQKKCACKGYHFEYAGK